MKYVNDNFFEKVGNGDTLLAEYKTEDRDAWLIFINKRIDSKNYTAKGVELNGSGSGLWQFWSSISISFTPNLDNWDFYKLNKKEIQEYDDKLLVMQI